ncbi:hypothetical protein AGRA3207_006520 [Actinomadura graeca]|uniref:Uncharacterized protein n=1 Tax=Actinomadura graeca TaxID=2750812 RepID=A0ABX8R1Z2_9ACTN|nr:hypothetical protein [Actinomadura graeca]QXJ25079.1 hypothetical protein AGRA3207_006520 [Actinomadura graeca]
MTGDLGSDADGARSRPTFLPPDDGYPPQDPPVDPVDHAPDARPAGRRGVLWDLIMIIIGGVLLVAAFLPWARAQVVVDLLGRPLSRDLGSVAGIDADDLVVAVPVLAVIAIVLAFWDLIARDSRIGGLAAVPAVLALLTCGVFVLRLSGVRDDLPGDALPEDGLDVGYEISVRYGWYLAVAACLLLIAVSLARPLTERLAPSRRYGPYAQPSYAEQSYTEQSYTDQTYAEQAHSEQSSPEPSYAGQGHAEPFFGEAPPQQASPEGVVSGGAEEQAGPEEERRSASGEEAGTRRDEASELRKDQS